MVVTFSTWRRQIAKHLLVGGEYADVRRILSWPVLRCWLAKLVILLLGLLVFLLLKRFITLHGYTMHMARNEQEFTVRQLVMHDPLREAVKKMAEPYAVVMLNQHALTMTLNWLCNTAGMAGVHERTLFFALDDTARDALLRDYPKLTVVRFDAPSIQSHFTPFDATYMSFFLLRTNLIRALLRFGKDFWMIQADTFWRSSLFDSPLTEEERDAAILLDHPGYGESAPSHQNTMNGANFFLPAKRSDTRRLLDKWRDLQAWACTADPDILKMYCTRGDFKCRFLDYKRIAGWEWIYGPQRDPPLLMQMDGETGGDKVSVLASYGLWFLDDWHSTVTQSPVCRADRVQAAIRAVESAQVPRVYSGSKVRQAVLMRLGELLEHVPLFSSFYAVYGGIPSLYLQIF